MASVLYLIWSLSACCFSSKCLFFFFQSQCKGPYIAACITTAGFEISRHTGSRHLYSHMCTENIHGQLLLRLASYAIKPLRYPSHVLLLSLAKGRNSATGYNQKRRGYAPVLTGAGTGNLFTPRSVVMLDAAKVVCETHHIRPSPHYFHMASTQQTYI